MNSQLKSRISIYKWDIQFKLVQDGTLPTFKGSLFRGVFGRVFKQVSCSMYHGDCRKCSISKACAYFNIFNLENEEEKNLGGYYTPRPYCLRDLPSKNKLKKGDIISIGFTLLGESNRQYLPYLFLSYNLMETSYLGKDQIQIEFFKIIDPIKGTEYLPNDDIPMNFGMIIENEIFHEIENYEIQFTTPLRIKFKGKNVFQLTKDSFLYNLKSRFKTLHQQFGIFIEDDIENIDDFEIIAIHEKITNNKRYSSRQNQKHYLPGIIGRYKIISNNIKLLHILKRLENLQIGKSTTFGFGQFKIIH